MARFTIDPNRLNFTVVPRGKEYNLRVLQRSQAIFGALLNLLPSNYISAIQGPNYTLELKAIAVELAKIELALEDVDMDRDFTRTRSEFIYSTLGYLVFINNRLPPLEFDDEAFRSFLLALVKIYFQGSIPKSIKDAVALFVTDDFKILENFLLTRAGASGLDISDEFGFQIDVEVTGAFPPGLFDLQASIRIILDIIRPAHTLFRIRYILKDTYKPNQPVGKVLDALRWKLQDYHYEDFRSYWTGIRDRDRLGQKVNQQASNEDHSKDF
jgi:hypothetical protein